MSEVTFADVLTYVATTATFDEIKALFAAGNARGKALHAADAAVTAGLLKAGDRVELAGVRPAYLNGLTGTFVRLDTANRARTTAKQRATVKLDEASAFKAGRYVNGSREIAGIPVSALKIVA
jgi:hypothetical protein